MMSRKGGGGGGKGTPKPDAVRTLGKGGCVKMQTREKVGRVKESENVADVICTYGPQGV